MCLGNWLGAAECGFLRQLHILFHPGFADWLWATTELIRVERRQVEVRVGVLVSPVVRGNVRTWLDFRSAVAVGVGIALGRALLAGIRAGARARGRE